MKVVFFARLRELLGSDSLELPATDHPADVASLRAALCLTVNAELAESLADPNVLCAVNKKVVGDEHPLSGSDEIAFFPPMTGG